MNRICLIIVACVTAFGLAVAQEQSKSRDVVIIGEVIDPKCYFLDIGTGKDHAACARQCAQNGIPLALLEEKTQLVYFIGKARGAGGTNDMLIPFIGEKINVKGKLLEKAGTRLLLLETVEKAK